MKIENIKIGDKLKLMPWEKVISLFKYDSHDKCVRIPYGDDSDYSLWDLPTYELYMSYTYTVKGFDEDMDVYLEGGSNPTISPKVLMRANKRITLNKIYSL